MDQTSKKTTIYDLAKLAGTSAGTVSAVLNGNWKKRRISEKLAEKVRKLADEHGYALNMQARALRKERSGIIGMIVPMYDNRYFSSIAQKFEALARDAGYFPIVTCTQRDPELEVNAARTMLAYQVEHIVCTGATDPDHIFDICAAAGVPTINLDLPGTRAPSIISNNYSGALRLTDGLLSVAQTKEAAFFVGGRDSDHNTKERIRGFRNAHQDRGIVVPETHILACGYAADKARTALGSILETHSMKAMSMFVNSTISLEGVVGALKEADRLNDENISIGCFDWDPFAALLHPRMIMVRQDVEGMLAKLFEMIEAGASGRADITEIQPIL